MAAYQMLDASTLQRLADGTCFSIPPEDSAETSSSDYLRYLDDLENGATVLPAEPIPEPEPSDAAMISEMLGSIEFGGNSASEELAAVMMALTGVLQARGF